MKINIHKSSDGQFYFNIVAKTGEVIATSETYHNKKDCRDTIKSIISQAALIRVVDKTKPAKQPV